MRIRRSKLLAVQASTTVVNKQLRWFTFAINSLKRDLEIRIDSHVSGYYFLSRRLRKQECVVLQNTANTMGFL